MSPYQSLIFPLKRTCSYFTRCSKVSEHKMQIFQTCGASLQTPLNARPNFLNRILFCLVTTAQFDSTHYTRKVLPIFILGPSRLPWGAERWRLYASPPRSPGAPTLRNGHRGLPEASITQVCSLTQFPYVWFLVGEKQIERVRKGPHQYLEQQKQVLFLQTP